MQADYYISVDDFCSSYQIEDSFVNSLQETGLIEVMKTEDAVFIDPGQLMQLEKFIHLHELDINLEGIEAIHYLLNQIIGLQEKVRDLQNRLRLYEE